MTKKTPMVKPNILLRADALTALRELPRGIADALITDPPYSSGGQFRGDRARDTKAKYLSSRKIAADYAKHSFTGDCLDQRSWTRWAAEWLSLARDAVRPGGVAAVFIDWRQLGTLCDAIQWAGWIWRGVIVWDKKQSRPQPGRPRQQCEFIVWASNGSLDLNQNAPHMPGIFTAPPHREKSGCTKRKSPSRLCGNSCAYAKPAAWCWIRLWEAARLWPPPFWKATGTSDLKRTNIISTSRNGAFTKRHSVPERRHNAIRNER